MCCPDSHRNMLDLALGNDKTLATLALTVHNCRMIEWANRSPVRRVQALERVSCGEEEVPVPETRPGAVQNVEGEGVRLEKGTGKGVACSFHGREDCFPEEARDFVPGRRGEAV